LADLCPLGLLRSMSIRLFPLFLGGVFWVVGDLAMMMSLFCVDVLW